MLLPRWSHDDSAGFGASNPALARPGGHKRFESSFVHRVATDRQSGTMTNWKPQTHATSTVQRNENGDIQHVKVRAEYFKEDLDAHENDSERYAEGVSARFKFDVVHGGLAVLDGVKDIDDGASTGYDTSLKFLRTVPVAEEAVSNVPGIENVQEAEEQIMDALERGQEAVEQ